VRKTVHCAQFLLLTGKDDKSRREEDNQRAPPGPRHKEWRVVHILTRISFPPANNYGFCLLFDFPRRSGEPAAPFSRPGSFGRGIRVKSEFFSSVFAIARLDNRVTFRGPLVPGARYEIHSDSDVTHPSHFRENLSLQPQWAHARGFTRIRWKLLGHSYVIVISRFNATRHWYLLKRLKVVKVFIKFRGTAARNRKEKPLVRKVNIGGNPRDRSPCWKWHVNVVDGRK
jgi:hypothetical protein